MKDNQTKSTILSFGILLGPLMIMSGYSVIVHNSMFGFVFFCTIVILIFIITLSVGVSNRLDQLEKSIKEQTDLIKGIKNGK